MDPDRTNSREPRYRLSPASWPGRFWAGSWLNECPAGETGFATFLPAVLVTGLAVTPGALGSPAVTLVASVGILLSVFARICKKAVSKGASRRQPRARRQATRHKPKSPPVMVSCMAQLELSQRELKLEKMVHRDFEPQAAIADVVKNARLVADLAAQVSAVTPLLVESHARFSAVTVAGYGAKDMAAILTSYERHETVA